MRSFTLKLGLAISLALLNTELANGLRCYTCDSEASGQKCIDSPGDLTQNDCTEGKDACFTYRREEPKESGEDVIVVARGCCRVKPDSSVCPPGDEQQTIVSDNPPYTIYLTRCDNRNNCNDDPGDFSGTEGGGSGAKVVVVPGRKNPK